MTNPCTVKRELLVAYSDAVKTHSELVFGLNEAKERISADEYLSLTSLIEQWRARTDRERIALENHIEEHGC